MNTRMAAYESKRRIQLITLRSLLSANSRCIGVNQFPLHLKTTKGSWKKEISASKNTVKWMQLREEGILEIP